MGSNQTWKLLHSKGNNQPSKKIICRMWQNICKGCDGQAVNIQNIQTAHTTQHQKELTTQLNMGIFEKYK